MSPRYVAYLASGDVEMPLGEAQFWSVLGKHVRCYVHSSTRRCWVGAGQL